LTPEEAEKSIKAKAKGSSSYVKKTKNVEKQLATGIQDIVLKHNQGQSATGTTIN
jgi:hypothetical protein